MPTILCDRHRIPMQYTEVTFAVPPRDVWTKNMALCSEPGCTRYYAIDRGYIDIRDRRIDDSKVVRKLCRKQGHEAEAIIAFIHGEPLWQCLEEDCLKGEGLNGAEIRIGDIVLAQGHGMTRFKVVGIDNNFATLRVVGDRGEGLVELEFAIEKLPVSRLQPSPIPAGK